jgi:membrane protease YdiL (CAAX protease family)
MESQTDVNVPEPSSDVNHYSAKRLFGIWALVTLPVALLAWGTIPFLSRYPTVAPILYWLLMTIGMGWVGLVALWAVRREEKNLSWKTLSSRIWLQPPPSDVGKPRRPVRWFLTRFVTLIFCIVVSFVGLLILLTMLLTVHTFVAFKVPSLRHALWFWPSYANILELVSPRYAGHWWLPAAVMALWFISSLIAEELLFRGVLLPRMQRRFGRWDWPLNGLMYAAYSIFQPWMVPVRLLDTLALAMPVRLFRSLRMGLIVRGVSTVGFCATLWIVLYEAPLKPLPPTLELPYVSREPEAEDFSRFSSYRIPLKSFPRFNRRNPWFSVDVKSRDLSHLDLQGSEEDLQHLVFDSLTTWPTHHSMPPAFFDPVRVLEIGKNPGLGVRQLHARGITGRGVAVGIVDNFLLTGHQEYSARLKWYEELAGRTFGQSKRAQMHAPAVASIAVGKSVGVAPEADLYFIGQGEAPQRLAYMFHYMGMGVRRFLEINKRLPEDRRIRVISISSGLFPGAIGADVFSSAVKKAEAQGILVLTCGGVGQDRVSGMGVASALADRDDFDSYDVTWDRGKHLCVPRDARTTASPTGTGDYVFFAHGGASWIVPYVAGAYALAAQVRPDITPEKFWSLALETGRYRQKGVGSRTIQVGPVLDMTALIEALQGETGDSVAATP